MSFRHIICSLIPILGVLAPSLLGGEEATSGRISSYNKELERTESFRQIFILPVHETIDWGLEYSIRRRVKVAREKGADLLIFDVNTFGGRLDAALEISKFVSDIEDVKTVAYVSEKALSAGALFAVSCKEIVMRKGTTLGDCAPIVATQEGEFKILGEKFQSPLRAVFRSLAERNGYPILLCEAMVTKETEVYRLTMRDGSHRFVRKSELDAMTEAEKSEIVQKKLVNEHDRLLTLTDTEALEYGFAKYRVEDEKELLQIYGPEAVATTLTTTWSEEMVRFLNSMPVASFLTVVGLLALYMAFKTPGVGLPEAVAVLCFSILFFSRYLVGLADAIDILIFVLGVALLAVEIFLLPGFGVTGIAGIALIVLGLLLSMQSFVLPELPGDLDKIGYNLLNVFMSMAASLILFFILVRFMPHAPILNRLVLQATQQAEAGYTVATAEQRGLLGKRGVALTTLRPSGRAEIGDQLVDVVSDGEVVEKGERIEVIEVKGNRVVVRRV